MADLTDKFEKTQEFARRRPLFFLGRLAFEPGYMIRIVKQIPKNNEGSLIDKTPVIAGYLGEACKIGFYALAIYMISK